MPISLTDEQAQALIVAETGTGTDAVVTGLLPQWWLLYSVKEADGAGLQYWYTRRAVLDYLLASERNRVNVKLGDDQFSDQQIFANLAALREMAESEILKIEGYSRGSLGVLSPVSNLPDAYADALRVRSEF